MQESESLEPWLNLSHPSWLDTEGFCRFHHQVKLKSTSYGVWRSGSVQTRASSLGNFFCGDSVVQLLHQSWLDAEALCEVALALRFAFCKVRSVTLQE